MYGLRKNIEYGETIESRNMFEGGLNYMENTQGSSIDALHEEMEALNRSEDYEKGLKCCDKVLELNPSDCVAWRYKGLFQRNMGELKNGTPREVEVRGDKEKALTYWSNALDDPWSLYYYGSTLWELERFEESMLYLKKSYENPPNQAIKGRASRMLQLYEDLVRQGRIKKA